MENPSYINNFSEALLSEFYMRENDSIGKLFERAALNYLPEHKQDLGQRILEYIYKGWLMPSSPILSNSPATHEERLNAMPISCFVLDLPDTVKGQLEANQEIAALSVAGGGLGLVNEIRAVSKKAPGPIPYFKTVDAAIGYYKQAGSRRGSCAIYMDVSHPDIIEFIKIRIPVGDSARKIENRKQVNNAVIITDDFIEAVINDLPWELKCPATGKVHEVVRARMIWEELLETRAISGEAYIYFKDRANRTRPQGLKDKNLEIKSSNLCSEILIPTNEERTAVCCLSSLNVEYFDEWKDTTIVEDAIEYLDYILQYFIDRADKQHLSKAIYSATQCRSLGLGTMGFHYYLQKNNIAFESGGFGSAVQANHKIYKHIKERALAKSIQLGQELGVAPDMEGYEDARRNVDLMAIAPNSNSGVIMQSSPSIDPLARNIFAQTTRAGTYQVKNKYLEAILHDLAVENNYDEEWVGEQWKSIDKHHGSVQHLAYLSEHQKQVFKTAYEIDQHWVVQHADDRAQYICQSQPVNLFFQAGVDKAYFNSVHMKAMKSEFVKTLYYCRMESEVVTADSKSTVDATKLIDWKAEECVACSG